MVMACLIIENIVIIVYDIGKSFEIKKKDKNRRINMFVVSSYYLIYKIRPNMLV